MLHGRGIFKGFEETISHVHPSGFIFEIAGIALRRFEREFLELSGPHEKIVQTFEVLVEFGIHPKVESMYRRLASGPPVERVLQHFTFKGAAQSAMAVQLWLCETLELTTRPTQPLQALQWVDVLNDEAYELFR